MAITGLAWAAASSNSISLEKKILIWSFSASSLARVKGRQEQGPRPRQEVQWAACSMQRGQAVGTLVSAPACTAFLLM